jgi:hypothetical protein
LTVADAYLETVRALWPEGEAPVLAHRGEPRRGELSLLVVPSPGKLRLLLPAGNPRAASRAMLRFSAAIGAPERAKRFAVAAAVRTGSERLLPHRIDVATSSGSLLEALGEELGSGPLDTSLSLGPVRSNRKPVLQLFDDVGRSLAFAKVGYSAAVRPNVARERAALEALARRGLPHVFELPRVLAHPEWSGMPTLVMSALPVPALARREPATAIPVDQMTLLARAFDEGRRPLPELPSWQRLLARREGIRDDELRTAFVAATDRLTELAASTPLAVGAWHGDWTAWNMSWHRGRLQLWDWERFETGVPVGMDRCHYAVNAAFLSTGLTAAAVRQGLALAGLAGATPGDADHAVVGCYVATVLDRYLMEHIAPQGPVAERVKALMQFLQAWVS